MEESLSKQVNFIEFVQGHLGEDPALLLFRYQGKVDFDLKMAVQQIAARQKMAKKLPSWTANPQISFPTSLGLEQCSSEITACQKSKNQSGNLMLDLTGGFGVDFFFLSQNFQKGIYCEHQAELFQLAKQNLKILSPKKFEFFYGDGLNFLRESKLYFDLIYADPARRGPANQKRFKLQDCEPNVLVAWELMKKKSHQILLKVSPMLDISQAWSELPDIQKIIILSVKNEVKELLLSWKRVSDPTVNEIEVHDLESDFPIFGFQKIEEQQASSTYSEVGKFLIEPLSGILKAGAFKLFGERYGLHKISQNSHLYTSDILPTKIPGRVFEVLEEIKHPKIELKAKFPDGKVNVITRNYAMGAEELKKKFSLRDGGEDFLIASKSLENFKIFHCKLKK